MLGLFKTEKRISDCTGAGRACRCLKMGIAAGIGLWGLD